MPSIIRQWYELLKTSFNRWFAGSTLFVFLDEGEIRLVLAGSFLSSSSLFQLPGLDENER